MMRRSVRLLALLCLTHAVAPPGAGAWGPLGHRMIAETAALLLQTDLPDSWGPLLSRHRFEIGYYSMVPDAVYRHKDRHNGEEEAPTHYFELDLITGTKTMTPEAEKIIDAIPRSFAAAKAHLEAKIGKEKFPLVGTAPWRVEQLQETAWQNFKAVKAVTGTYQRGNQSRGDTWKIYQGIYYLGVLSHYSGDATMPYHAVSDWNGLEIGQGGIHFYLEADCVNALEPGLSTDVLAAAKANRKRWLAEWRVPQEPPAGVMYRVFIDSARAVERAATIDRKHAVLKLSDPAKKDWAARKPPAEACKHFRPLLVERLAMGAALTAHLWDSVLPRNVDFSKSLALQFSDFMINPEYLSPNFEPPTFLDAHEALRRLASPIQGDSH